MKTTATILRLCLALSVLSGACGKSVVLGQSEVANVLPYSWSFVNFSSDHCAPPAEYYTWERYRETYIGVAPAPGANGFDDLFYNLVYEEELGSSGNCFGLSLLSLLINDKGGHLGFCGPVASYTGDNEGVPPLANDECEAEANTVHRLGPDDPELRRAVEEVHGHQVNLAAVRYTIDAIAQSQATPTHAYAMVQENAPLLINIVRDISDPFGAGHTMLAYEARQVGNERRIYVYDPNRSLGDENTSDHPEAHLLDQREWYENGDNHIKIFDDDSWEFRFGGWIVETDEEGDPVEDEDGFPVVEANMWPDGQGLMLAIPLSIVGPRDRNPAAMELSVTTLLEKIFLSGSNASLAQVSSPQGQFAFVPGTKQIELAPAKCLLEVFPFFPSDGAEAWGKGKELYFVAEPPDGPRDYEIRVGDGGYRFELASRGNIIAIEARGGARQTDVFRLEQQRGDTPRLMLYNRAGVDNYDIELTTSLGATARRALRIENLIMDEDGVVELRREGSGLVVTNPTGEVSFDLELTSTRDDTPTRSRVAGIVLEEGTASRLEPGDWDHLESEPLLGGARRLTTDEILEYVAPSPGPLGPDFENALDLSEARRGRTTYDTKTDLYTQETTGLGLRADGDDVHFAFTRMRGDFVFTAEFLEGSETSTLPDASWGLMVRESLDSSARFSYVGMRPAVEDRVSPRPGEARWVYRDESGTDEFDEHLHFSYDSAPPRFLKLVRFAAATYGFVSRDGSHWEPAGSHAWTGLEVGAEVFVGVASASGDERLPFATSFRVLELDELRDARLELLPHDGVVQGEVILDADYENDTAALAGFRTQSRGRGGRPTLVDGRLQLLDGTPAAAASAFSEFAIEDIDAAVYRFEFDLYLGVADAEPPRQGVTFVLRSGDDPSALGRFGDGLGYEGLETSAEAREPLRMNSLAVEIDFGTDEENTPRATSEAYHVGVNVQNHVDSHVRDNVGDTPSPFTATGVHVSVVYNRGALAVELRAQGGVSSQLRRLEAHLLPLSYSASSTRATFGFTGATGESGMVAAVDNLVVTRIDCDDTQEVASILGLPQEPLAVGVSLTLDGSASHGGAGDEAAERVTHDWEIIAGGLEIDGPTDGPTVHLLATASGVAAVRLTVDDGICDNPTSTTVEFMVEQDESVGGELSGGNWRRCDCNGDATNDITDAVFHLAWLFLGGREPSCIEACDCDSSGTLDITDGLFNLTFLFLQGTPPVAPYPACEIIEECENACGE